MIGTIIRKRPINMAKPSVVLYQGVLALSPANALPLLPVAGTKRIKNFTQSMRAGIIKPGYSPSADGRPGREAENRKAEDQQRQHRHLDFVGLNLLAQVFRCPAHHQPGDEYGQHDKHQHSVKPGAHSAENDFAQLNIEEWHKPTQAP